MKPVRKYRFFYLLFEWNADDADWADYTDFEEPAPMVLEPSVFCCAILYTPLPS